MSREIKYKALWRNEWYVIEEMSFYKDGSISVNKFIGRNFSPDMEHIKAIVQYTGFKDKFGREIYEDDIIKCLKGDFEGQNKRVCFWDGSWCIDYYGGQGNATTWYLFGLNEFGLQCEVLGNFFSNPELITLKKQ